VASARPESPAEQLERLNARAAELHEQYVSEVRRANEQLFATTPEAEALRGSPTVWARERAASEKRVKEAREAAHQAQSAVVAYLQATAGHGDDRGPYQQWLDQAEASRLARLRADLARLGVALPAGAR
jgi:hypothetical protein